MPLVVLVLVLAAAHVPPPGGDGARNTSGGVLAAEEACYDVLHYGLALEVDPEERAIRGRLAMRARVLARSPAIVLDLDGRLDVERVAAGDGRELAWSRPAGAIRVEDEDLCAVPGAELEVVVDYAGKPRVAPSPPWRGGFTWKRTEDGSPWFATSCQGEGADLWWPCKDHPSDEPESMDLAITVPAPLVVASNGRLVAVEPIAPEHAGEPGRVRYRWRVSTPIQNYAVAISAAPYETITRDYESVAGGTFPVTFWVLPENLERGRELFEEILAHLRSLEETFGPYPFRADKYGVAETPFLGMEHQTIVAYGNRYSGTNWGPRDWGFDDLHHHELAHEWWGNLVTARDWKDMWIHEGFATYAQALHVEELHGRGAYHEQMGYQRGLVSNRGPVAPRRTMDTHEIYFGGAAGSPGADVYAKGACVLHALRFLLGDEAFFRCLRRMAYPDPALEATTDGSACRLTSTDELVAIAEEVSGRELGWFFEVYVRRAALPVLGSEREDGGLRLRWRAPDGLPFPMPVEVRIGDETRRVEMPGGEALLPVDPDHEVAIDPDGWLLKTRR